MRQPPLKVQIEVDECMIMMEVDTGASISIMSKSEFLISCGLGESCHLPIFDCKIIPRNKFR